MEEYTFKNSILFIILIPIYVINIPMWILIGLLSGMGIRVNGLKELGIGEKIFLGIIATIMSLLMYMGTAYISKGYLF